MLTHLLFSRVPGVRVDRLWREDRTIHVNLTTTRRAARCPCCGCRAKRVHSRYTRTLADLPCCGDPVIIHLHTRRFVCRVRRCAQKIFTERIPTLVAPSARRTVRLQSALERDGFALGGEGGARHAAAGAMPVSPRTLLRIVRAVPIPDSGPVTALGVDDWAQRKGRTYGTILVNLETHRAIDLLPDRTAETFAAWLSDRPEPAIISRDRGGAYAEGARQGAPHALQVADRFHLLKNVTDGFERFLIGKHAMLRQAARAASTPDENPTPDPTDGVIGEQTVLPAPNRAPCEQQARRAQRYARYAEVRDLHTQGHSIRAIARLTGLNRRTVRRFLRAEGFPEHTPRAPRSQLITPFVPFLRARWDAGCHNAMQLWSELRGQGFTGSYSIVAAHLRTWRDPSAGAAARHGAGTAHPTRSVTVYSPRQTVWLLLQPTETLTAAERTYVLHLQQHCPDVLVAQALVAEFATVLKEHEVDGLYAWLHRAEECGIAEFCTLARGMWLDRSAVEAAVATEWSNGQTEGQVNRLKVLKRAMYGRAKFDLLRQRMLYTG